MEDFEVWNLDPFFLQLNDMIDALSFLMLFVTCLYFVKYFRFQDGSLNNFAFQAPYAFVVPPQKKKGPEFSPR